MNELLQKYKDYTRIKNCKAKYQLSNGTTLSYSNAVINFNPKLINSKIKSDFLVFEEKINKEYNHLGISLDTNTNNRYIETFFHQKTDMYIKGQNIVKVDEFTLYSPTNEIIVQDTF